MGEYDKVAFFSQTLGWRLMVRTCVRLIASIKGGDSILQLIGKLAHNQGDLGYIENVNVWIA